MNVLETSVNAMEALLEQRMIIQRKNIRYGIWWILHMSVRVDRLYSPTCSLYVDVYHRLAKKIVTVRVADLLAVAPVVLCAPNAYAQTKWTDVYFLSTPVAEHLWSFFYSKSRRWRSNFKRLHQFLQGVHGRTTAGASFSSA